MVGTTSHTLPKILATLVKHLYPTQNVCDFGKTCHLPGHGYTLPNVCLLSYSPVQKTEDHGQSKYFPYHCTDRLVNVCMCRANNTMKVHKQDRGAHYTMKVPNDIRYD